MNLPLANLCDRLPSQRKNGPSVLCRERENDAAPLVTDPVGCCLLGEFDGMMREAAEGETGEKYCEPDPNNLRFISLA